MHIKELSLYNVYKDGETSRLKFETPLTILTGYNGSGKTTLLGIIHSTLSMIAGEEYQFPKSNWGCEISLKNETKLFHAKIARPVKPNFKPPTLKGRKETIDPAALENFYKRIFSETIDPSKQIDTIVKKEGEGRPSLSINIVNIIRNTQNEEVKLSSTLYCDEIFNSKEQEYESQKLEELDIFSKNKNLDKTLLLLLKDFSSEVSDSSTSTKVYEQWQELLEIINLDQLKAKKELAEHIRSIRNFNIKKTDTNTFLEEANIFFKKTHRTLIINEKNLLALKTNRGEVQWYDFSKGEKTLICLLLAAHLNRSAEKIFLLDEPDLSLHITWQKQLLPSLQKLSPNSQFIVATHSPALVGRCENEKIINIASLSRA
ncbi:MULTISPECIES: AAA family ATPase [unclassified Pseudomonas]|uniref:AAA family ATPase n=1 Tax=unclassified Pseudomonas TaxID=196821 RepID=UPI00385AC663